MPLSEHEQRMLEQMERALYAEDPKFASALQGADVRSHYQRRALQAAVGILAGIGVLVAGLVIRLLPVTVVGIALVLVSSLLAITTWRRIPAPGEIARPTPQRPRPHLPRLRRSRQHVRLFDRMEERWQRRHEGGFNP